MFDPDNPRLGGGPRSKNQDALQEILLGEPHFAIQLVESFVANGFIEYEPLVVRQTRTNYVVIEGNRRLAAVKHILSHPQAYRSDRVEALKNVPVLIFRQSTAGSDAKEILTYLGIRHLLGYREWPAESKALFLDQNIRTKADLKRLKSEFAITSSDIRRYLIPYRVRKAAASLIQEFETIEDESFWTLGEALQRSGIKEYIKLDVDPATLKVRGFDKTKFQYLLEFLYGTRREAKHGTRRAAGMRRITETRQLTRLGRVLANKRASEKLENGSTLEEAEFYVETPAETINGLIYELRVSLQRIITLKPSDAQVKEIERCFKNFMNAIKSFEGQ